MASRGAPITMPIAKAEMSSPASGMPTFRSAAMPGSRPVIMNSDVPSANTLSPSMQTAKGKVFPSSFVLISPKYGRP
jgi:hypothetical protein